MIETISTLVMIAATVGGSVAAFGRSLWVAVSKLDRRFDTLEEKLTALDHRQELERTIFQSRIDQLQYQIDTQVKYGINANRELIQHKVKRLESAISNLSSALEKVSEGKYVSRSGSELISWPTDDPPTAIT